MFVATTGTLVGSTLKLYSFATLLTRMKISKKIKKSSVLDPDPVGSGTFSWIRIHQE